MPEPTDQTEQIKPMITCHCGTTISGYLSDDAANLLDEHECPKSVDLAGYVVFAVVVAIICATIVTLKIVA